LSRRPRNGKRGLFFEHGHLHSEVLVLKPLQPGNGGRSNEPSSAAVLNHGTNLPIIGRTLDIEGGQLHMHGHLVYAAFYDGL
jgi:hypothetical protein